MKTPSIIDISWPISPKMTTYKDSKTVIFSPIKEFEQYSVRDSDITLNTHTGTHVDAPAHYLKNGKKTEEMPLKSLVGSCQILDFTNVAEKITGQDLSVKTISEKIVLLKTKNSTVPVCGPFKKNFVYLSSSGAKFLADQNVKTVGIDSLGIERNQPEHETHKILLDQEILIVEGLRLQHVEANKTYFFCCLPLMIQGLEASPARAILFE
jgi:arylformamidase